MLGSASPVESPIPGERSPAPLHRSAVNRICCGVCGGIAESLAVDPTLVRLAFVTS
jgi:PspC domain